MTQLSNPDLVPKTPPYSAKGWPEASESISFFSGAWRLSFLSLILVALAGWYGLSEVETQMKANLEKELTTILRANGEFLKMWLSGKIISVENWAGEPVVQKNILSLAVKARQTDATPEMLLRSAELASLREALEPVVKRYNYAGFVVFDGSGRQIAALLDEPIGRRAIMERSDFVQRSLKGKTTISLPFLSEVPIPTPEGEWKMNWPTMFVSAPVRDHTGAVVAALAFRIRPETNPSHIMNVSRSGNTGETYLFDAEGLMLSDSRFNDQLRKIGLIPDNKDSHAILNVQLRDPGGNLVEGFRPSIPRNQQPLTRMAALAAKGESGIDVNGYRDYRGVPVVGAWIWLPEHQFGIATEKDLEEAYAPLLTLKRVFLSLFGFLTAVMIIALVLRVRHSRAEEIRLQAEKSLRQRERELAEAQRIAHLGNWSWDAVRNKALWSDEVYRIFGLKPEEFGATYEAFLTSVHPGDREFVKKSVDKSLYEKAPYSIDYRIVLPGGAIRIVHAESEVVYDETGRAVKMVGTLQDITERKLAEEALKKSAAYVQLLKEVAVAANEARTVESAMQAAIDHVCQIIGWPVGHLYLLAEGSGSILVSSDLWHIDDPEKFSAFKEVTDKTKFDPGIGLPGRVLANRKPEWIADVAQDPNFPRIRKNGNGSSPQKGTKNIVVRAGFGFPVFCGKEVVAVLEFFFPDTVERDDQLLEVMVHIGIQLGRVIERKRAETELQLYATDLEQRNQELRDFTFIASHDLQEPLRKVMSFSDRLAETNAPNLDERGRHYLTRMQAAVLRMQSFIYDLLAYSRVAAEYKEREPICLSEIVDEILSDMKEEIDQTGARIETNPLPVIEATYIQIRNLLQNLISNALKFRKSGRTPRIVILGRRKESGFWEITVEDNGTGFDKKHAERIFKPFQRLHRRDEFPGSGMGLTICQKVATSLGGTIAVQSEPDVGSKFIVHLPERQP